ncbi:MAG: ATP-binding protein [Patescibacteria group bacterium]|nr:ATP-binding protein [Patescibacteria group bacterium]
MNTSEWKEIKELFDFGLDLVHTASSKKFDKISKIIVESAAKIAQADRVCLMLLRQNSLYVEEGFPLKEHGIGEKIMSDTGEKFLKGVIDSRTMVYIPHPKTDIRTNYMKGIIEFYCVASILFVPLYEEEDIGLITFDFQIENSQRFNKDYLVKMRFLANAVAKAFWSRRVHCKNEEKMKRNEKMCALDENSLRVAHSIRTNLAVIGGNARRLNKILEKTNKTSADEIKEITKNIIENVYKMEKIVGDVLTFSKIPKINPHLHNLNDFLKRAIADFIFSGAYPDIKFNQSLDKKLNDLKVNFDVNLLDACVADIVRNVYEAKAKKIWFRTKTNIRHGIVSIFIANDGEGIDKTMMKEIFSPFMTTKPDGTGLGLANVKNIIVAHGGDISVACNNKTEFNIELPL